MKNFNIFIFFLPYTLFAKQIPLVSIITSVYNGDSFIKGFMHDIVQQTIFKKCELIIRACLINNRPLTKLRSL